ncbi:ABC transporter ATP-binding protein [soil metagenome]
MNKEALITAIKETYGSDTAHLLEDLAKSAKRSPKRDVKGEVLVDVQNVSRTYKLGKTTVQALNDMSLQVKQGEIIALTGPSGSGKSTLLHLIAGLDKPTSGSVNVGTTTVSTLSSNQSATYRAEQLGFVFQFFYLQPFLTLSTNVKVPTMFVNMSEAERSERAKTFIEAVGLSDRASHLPRELSGGQMQRAAIARSLMNHPKLILADEPTGNLDSANATLIMEEFEKVRQTFGTTIIVVTHDHRVAALADREVSMKDGSIL